MKFYIIRHGETLFNQKGLIQGWSDSPLTEKGLMQAKCAGYGLKDVVFEHAYSSSSERTLDTCRSVLDGRDVEITPTKKLKEMNFGRLEGDHTMPEFFPRMTDKDGFHEFGGENYEETAARIVGFLKETAVKHTGNVLIVTHGAAIMHCLEVIEPGIVDKYMKMHRAPENCSVSVLEYKDGEFEIIDFCNLEYRQKGEKYYAIS